MHLFSLFDQYRRQLTNIHIATLEICQTACKLAIREDIIHEADVMGNELEEEEEFLPEVLPRHFEEAVRSARKSVSDRDLAQYQAFAKALSHSRGALTGTGGRSLMNFTFPTPQRQVENGNAGSPMQLDDDEEDLYS
jgi:transitional endoplasmic reticulum ATPase